MAKKLTTQEFITKAKKIHKDTYDYSNVDYKGSKTKVKIRCKIHGEFSQVPSDHLRGKGCPKCGYLRVQKTLKGRPNKFKNTSKWTLDLLTKEAQKYTTRLMFSKGSHAAYQSAYKRGLLDTICRHMTSKHTSYTPESVAEVAKKYTKRIDFRGNCPGAYNYVVKHGILNEVCGHMSTVGGFNKNKPAILYYLRIQGGIAYKIGITNLSINERYSAEDLAIITPVKAWYYAKGEEAYQQEQKILKTYKYAQYKGNTLLYDGNTELFDRDILLIDT